MIYDKVVGKRRERLDVVVGVEVGSIDGSGVAKISGGCCCWLMVAVG